ncbi:MAG: lactate dehydrogenase [Candidatus Methanomethylophilaceae archaeon]|nr:lactate dehydrogenase [Candidatus Methanomethylophilaceae archaeon]
MKLFVYDMREFDEAGLFEEYGRQFGIEVGSTDKDPSIETYRLAEGYDAISVITTPIDAELIDRFKSVGVRMISTRTIGYDHIDIGHARECGMVVTHITYDPEGVADYTVMLMLMAVRKVGLIMSRNVANDFTLEGLLGRRMRDLRIGIVGAGRIGISVMRDLSGFGSEVLYTSRNPKTEADRYGRFVDMDELLGTCDIVSLHLELNGDTRHVIGSEALAKMKEGTILVNTARGPLVDTDALLDSLESGHISVAALDVIEGEFGLYYNDCRGMDLEGTALERLRSRDDVILTHHMAFYYDTAIRDMVRNCLISTKMMDEGKEIPYRLD